MAAETSVDLNRAEEPGIGAVPSDTFLFDASRTARTKFDVGDRPPETVWEFTLRSHPAYAPESCPVFNASGDLFFGAHDGCFYSLSSAGDLRWMFKTSRKVYSSPSLTKNGSVVFCCGDGRMYCLDESSGMMNWVTRLDHKTKLSSYKRRCLTLVNLFRYEYSWKQRLGMKCWSSPLLSDDQQTAFVLSRGSGGHAINLATGECKWTAQMGQPWNHLSSFCADKEFFLYAPSQQRFLFKLNTVGQKVWQFDSGRRLNAWGTPSHDQDRGCVYFTQSRGTDTGFVICVDAKTGTQRWSTTLPGGTRGGVAISHQDFLAVACLSGHLVFLRRDGGVPYATLRVTDYSGASLWTTPSITPSGKVLLACVEGAARGALRCFDPSGRELWSLPDFGKALSTPVVDRHGNIYCGSWQGKLACLATN